MSRKKLLAVLLCLAMFAFILPVSALAEEPSAELMQEELEAALQEQATEPEVSAEEPPAYEEPAPEEEAVEEELPEAAEEVWPEETPDAEQSVVVKEPEALPDAEGVDAGAAAAPENAVVTEPATEAEAQEPAEPAGESDTVPVEIEAEQEPIAAEEDAENTETATLQAETEKEATLMAYSGTCGENVTWTLDDEGTLTISGTGAMSDYATVSAIPWDSCRSQIKKVIIEPGITNIVRYAFQNCSSFASIEIPSGVTNIGGSAFYGCSSLTSVEIPAGVTIIGAGAFFSCNSLTSIEIPSGVTSIARYAFCGCSSLASIDIPASVTEIEMYAFCDCSSLTSIDIPASVTEIGSFAFYNCSSLTSMDIPAGVTSIGESAFEGCSSLQSIIIPDSVTSIGPYAFAGCAGLKKVVIPSGVSCDPAPFYGCNGLTTAGPIGGGYDLEFGWSTEIPWGALGGCGIKRVVLPDTITKIKRAAFIECSALEEITIPRSVKEIDEYAFADCDNLRNIYFLGGAPESIGSNSFESVTAAAYYPGDGSWKEENLQDYGGHLTWIATFSDVNDPTAYFYQPVYWAVEYGITSGTSATTFSPYNSCTRAQVMAFLYKAMGSPEVSGSNPFTDVKESDYFYKPVLWAVSQGITSGTSATTFSPYNPCTRAQVMSFLYKAMGSPEVSGSNPFTDVKESDYFYKPVLWAVSRGITNGTSATTFGAYNTCTRAQVMTFLYKAMN